MQSRTKAQSTQVCLHASRHVALIASELPTQPSDHALSVSDIGATIAEDTSRLYSCVQSVQEAPLQLMSGTQRTCHDARVEAARLQLRTAAALQAAGIRIQDRSLKPGLLDSIHILMPERH